MHQYEKQRDSRIKELGKIPNHWTAARISSVCEIRGRIGWRGLTTEDYRDEGPVLLGVTNITENFTLDMSTLTRISKERYEESPEIIVQQNDILLAKSGATTGKVCIVEEVSEPMTVNAAVNILRPMTEFIFAKYLYYYLVNPILQDRLFSLSSISAQPNLFQRDIKKIDLAIPPMEEQKQIARFLDNKIKKLDDLILGKEQLLQLLLEQRQAIVDQVVKHGLYSESRMKNSGIEWIGEIPEHWNLKKLKFVARSVSRKTDEGTRQRPYIGLENVESKTGRLLGVYSDEVEGDSKNFETGHILFGKLRPYLAKAFFADFPGRCTGEFLILESKGIFQKFCLFLLLCDGFVKTVDSSTFGAKMPRAEWPFIGNMYIPIPDNKEQESIASFLELKTKQIDLLVGRIKEQIEKLTEYRRSYIAMSVTGRMDFREGVIA